ncbi:MAG: VWA domain-containing protein [Acidobacteria bacterium]|nr:VWA domain-containing protein [Acidobacteriota bacterium]
MRSRRMIRSIMAVLLVLPSTLLFAEQDGHPASHGQTSIKVAVDLVPLSVMVTDQKGQAITGLRKEDFKVYEDGVEQAISFYDSEKAPVSWGLVLDRSGSMREMIEDVYRAALHVMDEGSEQDEMFVVTFNDQVRMVRDFTSDRRRLENSILGLRAGGQTALYDAVVFALDHIQSAEHQKKVLVVVTDGEDNRSEFSFAELLDQAGEQDVLVYTAGMDNRMSDGFLGLRARRTHKELKKLAEVSGGAAHFPRDQWECRETMNKIAYQVSHQYSLGYYPTNPARDGQWRNIQVTVNSQQKAKYVARTRAGYYAPRGDRLETKR